MTYGITVTVDRPFSESVQAVREALATQGFGILTEIDMAATLKAKLDVEIPPQVILGACNPPLAHGALQVEPAIGLLLPCNVVVRASGDDQTTVAALDPDVMVSLTGNDGLRRVAQDAGARLRAALTGLADG